MSRCKHLQVLSAHKFRGKNQTVVSHLISQPLSIHVHHPSLQPMSANPCLGDKFPQCSQLCLLSPSDPRGYTCKCKPGYRVQGSECVEGTDYLIRFWFEVELRFRKHNKATIYSTLFYTSALPQNRLQSELKWGWQWCQYILLKPYTSV